MQNPENDRIKELQALIGDRDAHIFRLNLEISETKQELAHVYRSMSWRVTSPLRRTRRILGRVSGPFKKSFAIFAGKIVSKVFRKLPCSAKQMEILQNIFFARFPGVFAADIAFRLWEIDKYQLRSKEIIRRRIDSLTQSSIEDKRLYAISLPVSENPYVSIIIPVYGQINYTLNCLFSLTKSKTKYSFEVIVVNDCSTDDTQEKLHLVDGVRVLANATNLGFIRSCNKAAKSAKGSYLVFLNNDTEVMEGWLDGLIDCFAAFPDAGLVGSKLLYTAEYLQEAGVLLWDDATGFNIGRLANPDHPEYNYVRDVDYCSGASIAITRELFEHLGGFDERYVPAYYEDSDLAFAVRDKGYRVLYQPTSEVIHYEGITSGKTIDSGIKAHQASNRLVFLEKWASQLAHHKKPGDWTALARNRAARAQVLIIDATTPTPDQDSGSLDAYYLQKTLLELGYSVTFVPENFLKLDGYTESLQQHGIKCIYAPHVPTLKAYLEQSGAAFDLVILTRAMTAHGAFKLVKRYCPKAKIIFNTVDVHYLRLERQAALIGSEDIAKEAKLVREIELNLMCACDTSIIISEAEAELLRQEHPGLRLTVMPYMREIPGCKNPFSVRKDIIFIGGFEHAPNIDAVDYFVQDIWPLVRSALPDARFLIIGSKMPDAIKCLDHHPGIEVVGYVKDLSEYFDHCKLSVIPLRYGAGIKGKIGTSASFGVPCVATSIAAEGMGLTDGEHVLIADTPERFAEQVIRLYRDERIWNTLSQSSMSLIHEKYSLDAGKRRLEAMLCAVGV